MHDRLVREAINGIAKEVGVIVLAQASMARIVPLVQEDVNIPVLSSPGLAIERIKVMWENQDFV